MVRSPPNRSRTNRKTDSRLVSIAAIRRFAARVAERFQPDRIVLFGSYARGQPHELSDVDILVVMPARNEIDKAVQIWNETNPPFDVDLIVRTPRNLEWRLREGDWFLRDVIDKGRVLYEKTHTNVGPQSRGRSPDRPARIRRGRSRQ